MCRCVCAWVRARRRDNLHYSSRKFGGADRSIARHVVPSFCVYVCLCAENAASRSGGQGDVQFRPRLQHYMRVRWGETTIHAGRLGSARRAGPSDHRQARTQRGSKERRTGKAPGGDEKHASWVVGVCHCNSGRVWRSVADRLATMRPHAEREVFKRFPPRVASRHCVGAHCNGTVAGRVASGVGVDRPLAFG